MAPSRPTPRNSFGTSANDVERTRVERTRREKAILEPSRPTRDFLRHVARRIRRERPVFAASARIREELDAVPPFAIVWFASPGCSFDRAGECLACNYGHAPAQGDPVAAVAEILAAHPPAPGATLILSPSGSLLDDAEVPPATRDALLALAAATDAARIGCETRIETLSVAKVDAYARRLAGKAPFIELGVESADPFVLVHALHKSTDPALYAPWLNVLHQRAITAVANVCLGAPGLSPAEATDDALATVRWAFAQGFDHAVLFPLHAKRWTILGWLWQEGLYEPPSLWQIADVLTRLSPNERSRVTLGWVDPDQEIDVSRSLLLASPGACPACRAPLLAALNAFARTGDELPLARVVTQGCPCHDATRSARPSGTAADRLWTAYERLGRAFLTPQAWEARAPAIAAELDRAWARRAAGDV